MIIIVVITVLRMDNISPQRKYQRPSSKFAALNGRQGVTIWGKSLVTQNMQHFCLKVCSLMFLRQRCRQCIRTCCDT